jgi:hypothetical protein
MHTRTPLELFMTRNIHPLMIQLLATRLELPRHFYKNETRSDRSYGNQQPSANSAVSRSVEAPTLNFEAAFICVLE